MKHFVSDCENQKAATGLPPVLLMAKRDFFGQISQNFPTIRYIKNSPRSGAELRDLPKQENLTDNLQAEQQKTTM